jgi:hypothetical protein
VTAQALDVLDHDWLPRRVARFWRQAYRLRHDAPESMTKST